jgi:hypothetical protein
LLEVKSHSFCPANVDVLTNNLFGLTAFPHLVQNVSPVKGNLMTQYFGFFPFAEVAPTTQRGWKREIVGYNRLADDIQQCNEVFATCSHFSALAGPLVGSRGNALTKHAICTGRTIKCKFSIAFHFEKYIPLSPTCFTRFHMSEAEDSHRVYPRGKGGIWTQFDSALKNDSAIRGSWHVDHWLRRNDPLIDAFVSAAEYEDRLQLATRASQTWLDSCNGIYLLIALPEDDFKSAMEALKSDFDLAQKLAMAAMHDVKFTITSDADLVKEHKVLEVYIEHRA